MLCMIPLPPHRKQEGKVFWGKKQGWVTVSGEEKEQVPKASLRRA